MASNVISIGVGIPMMVVGALMALFLPQYDMEIASTIEFIGSLIGILGAIFFISGLFYTKQPITH
ncbi:MAG: putative membrane protein [Cenarchaeum symbiont of Oopsacas minuta]|nr:putative membrane protein [Cenarchaeum symbiont of Oopsacas minuta]